ncbi:hypothetical protein HYALB_00004565 [Hymenoscyphus albidus]|uniref:RING-type domain-containing protein n=1 Tax=Hymenoscyphus albidus TaxID=595503 RepID=A0A9N9M2W9_9HELO|nr:hypothetical protein HYALB_00004565 [Hymenoscyphus albidus]
MSCFGETYDQLDQPGQPSRTIQHGQRRALQQRGCVGNLVEQTIKHSDGSYRRIFRWSRSPPKNSIARASAATQGNLFGPAVADLASSTTDLASSTTEARSEERECSICLRDYEDWKQMDVVVDDCRHEFCVDCILGWIYHTLQKNVEISEHNQLYA